MSVLPQSMEPTGAVPDPGPQPSSRSAFTGDFARGAATMAPLVLGYAPFACLIGMAVAASSAPAAAWSGVWLIFAGNAHLATIQLVDAGSSVLVAALSALAINVRLLLFSATLAPQWRGTPVWHRLLAAATVIDPSWMVTSRVIAEGAGPAAVRRFYAGASAALALGWSALVAVGAVAGNLVPAGWGLELLAPLSLVALVVPRLRSWAGLACGAAAMTVAVVGAALPAGLAVLLAMPAGVLAAGLFERPDPEEVSR